MVRQRLLCGFFVAVAALAQLVVWLVIRPDLAGPQWSEGSALEAWLGLEALTVVVIGCAVLAAAGVGLALGARALAGRAVRRPPHG
jgi:hypothetical protein